VTYFWSVAFVSAGALDADFAIDVVGTMMCRAPVAGQAVTGGCSPTIAAILRQPSRSRS
jgi:hypothetical protein